MVSDTTVVKIGVDRADTADTDFLGRQPLLHAWLMTGSVFRTGMAISIGKEQLVFEQFLSF